MVLVGWNRPADKTKKDDTMSYPTEIPAAQVIIMIADGQPDPQAYIEDIVIDMARAINRLEMQASVSSGQRIALNLHRADKLTNVAAEVVRLAHKYD